eukprot:IDg21856t1
MTLSMRRQTAAERNRQARDYHEQQQRERAVQLLRGNMTVAEAIRLTGVRKSTCYKLKKAITTNNSVALKQLVDVAHNRAGRRPVISDEENLLIAGRIRYAASRGFAFDIDTLKSVMAQVAADGREGFRTVSGVPSDDAVRAWRAR